jgi:hypothetical protein
MKARSAYAWLISPTIEQPQHYTRMPGPVDHALVRVLGKEKGLRLAAQPSQLGKSDRILFD